MRLFVAIVPPERLGEQIAAETGALRGVEGVRWVEAAALHVTLKFIGETTDPRAGEVAGALERACAGHGPMDLWLSSIGAFPNLKRPRVVWLGIESSEALHSLHEDVEGALESLGVRREERAFHPHLTLGRARRGMVVDAGRLQGVVRRTAVTGSWRAESVALVRSRLRRSGAVYETRASVRLTGDRTKG